jgi:hypothetical protein
MLITIYPLVVIKPGHLTRPSLHHPYCTFPLLDLGIPTLLSLFNNVFPFYRGTFAFNHYKDFPLLGEELQQGHDGTLAFFRKRSLSLYILIYQILV